jgi:hypothetical protein
MDVADAAGEEVDAEISDLLALLGVCDLALRRDAVLGAADAADLGLDGDALAVGDLHELLGVGDVRGEVLLVRAVVHDRGEAGLDALVAVLVRAVVEVEGHRHGDVLVLDELVDERGDDLEAGLPLGGAARALDDQRGLLGLGGVEDRRRPLQVVRVERADAVVPGLGLLEHVGCVD